MFFHFPDSVSIDGRIFCVREGSKGIGKDLLDFAYDHKITYWKINSLPYENLINYCKENHKIYDIHGFVINFLIYNSTDFLKKPKLQIYPFLIVISLKYLLNLV